MGDLVFFKLGPRHGMRRGTSALAWYERGCALEAADVDGAIAAYRRAIAGRPDLADAHNNLGRVLHDRGDLAAAEACYRAALAHDPHVALYYFNLGVVLEDGGRAEEAIGAYEQAASVADAHYNLARLLERRARAAGDDMMMRRAVRHLARYRELSRAG
ncbi:MAG: tetratricopeptide repeat protein [Acidobacteriota bacterium]